jgi:hypothetical protein
VPDVVDQNKVDDVVNQNRVDDVVEQNRVADVVNQNRVPDIVNQNKVDDEVNQTHIDDVVNQIKVDDVINIGVHNPAFDLTNLNKIADRKACAECSDKHAPVISKAWRLGENPYEAPYNICVHTIIRGYPW